VAFFTAPINGAGASLMPLSGFGQPQSSLECSLLRKYVTPTEAHLMLSRHAVANLLKSPWWLVRNDRIDEARKVLTNLVAAEDTDYDVDRNIAMMIHTNAHEKAVSAGTSYRDCFTGVDLRRTEITCMVWILQITCGIWFGGNVTYFLEQAGMSGS
jgi:hypothetical protein